MRKKILLVGGCGFIGHNLAIHLKNKGHQIKIVDSLKINNLYADRDNEVTNQFLYESILKNRLSLLKKNQIDYFIKDAKDLNETREIFDSIDPDTIIHLAAVSHANKSNKDPHTTFDHTLRTLENTMDIAKSLDCRVIYFSSSMAYGHFEKEIVTEESPCNPLGIYGTLKYSGELIVKAYHRVFDIPYTIVRPSALYGDRCVSRRVGQIFIENAVQGLDINIQGDGSDKLDFTYIDDLTHGIELIVENDNAINQTFNLTYGEAKKIGEMAEILEEHFNDIKINYGPKDKLTPNRGTLSVDKAKNLLGYNPKNYLEIGYPKYIQWYKKFWKSLSI